MSELVYTFTTHLQGRWSLEAAAAYFSLRLVSRLRFFAAQASCQHSSPGGLPALRAGAEPGNAGGEGGGGHRCAVRARGDPDRERRGRAGAQGCGACRAGALLATDKLLLTHMKTLLAVSICRFGVFQVMQYAERSVLTLQTLNVHTPAECSEHNLFSSSCNNSDQSCTVVTY